MVRQPLELKRDYLMGKLSPQEFRMLMREHHIGLEAYRQLIQGSWIKSICIFEDGLRIILQNNLQMYWNPNDLRSVPSMLVNHGDYEREELALLEFLARESHVIMDIGANAGWYSLHFARIVSTNNGKVYSFEPVPYTYAELKRNIELNNFSAIVSAFNLALSDTEHTVELFIPTISGSVAASQKQLFPDEENETVKCRAISLDAFAHQLQLDQLDLVKCDVEGAELFVIRGALQTIRIHKPVLMLEMLRKWARLFGYHPNDIIELLGQYDYACWSFKNGCMTLIRQIDEYCTQTNFFFLHQAKHKNLPERINQAFQMIEGHS
jgi:FkbM family methyltransferase